MVANDFKDFKEFWGSLALDALEIADEKDNLSEMKVIISQFETNKLCLFAVSEDDNHNLYFHGHYGICDLNNENNSISICL